MAEIRRRHWSPSLKAGLVMAGLLVLTAILAPIFLSSAADQLSGDVRQGPSAAHWLGTDQFGRDILARSLVATRLTLTMSLLATALSAAAGVFIGGIIWLAPRWLRETVLRIIDSTVAFPALILALVIAAILGPGSGSAIVAIGVAGIPSFARITSNMTASVVHRDYVTTARLLGVPAVRVFARHLLPNISGPLLVLVASSFALSLLEISSLSFVGLGVQSPEYDYGRLLNEGLPSIYNQPLQVVSPSLLLIYAGITAMLIGDGLATTIDPRFRRRTRRVAALPAPAPQAPAAPGALVEVDNLTVATREGTPLVKGISFTIDDGEIVGLVGESGSGKSMTAMALAGLLADGVTARASTMRLGDMDLTRRNPAKRLATEIGLVYQDPGTT
ncbi:MAG TPA: ABC transporter permease subunit, partial [Naasia sp.]